MRINVRHTRSESSNDPIKVHTSKVPQAGNKIWMAAMPEGAIGTVVALIDGKT